MASGVHSAITAAALAVPLACAPAAAQEPPSIGFPGPWVQLKALGALTGAAAGFASSGPKSILDHVVLGFDADLSGPRDARRAGAEPASSGAIRARVGYAFDRFVAFGTAGLAFAPAGAGRANGRGGWTAGGGIEAALFGGVSATAEYRYVDLDRQALETPADVSLPAAGGQIRAALNVRF